MILEFPKIFTADKEELIKNHKFPIDEIVKRNAILCVVCQRHPTLTVYETIVYGKTYNIRCSNKYCDNNSTKNHRKTNTDNFVDTLNYWNFMQWYHDNKPFQFTTPPSKIIIPETYRIKTFFSISDV